MSTAPGKVQVLGTQEIMGQKVFVLNFLQGRNTDWIGKPFFAKYDSKVPWLNELKPIDGKDYFLYKQKPFLRAE